MSPGATRIFNVGVVLSIILGLASVVAAAWTARYEFPDSVFEGGLPVGNKELIGFRQGMDFLVATKKGFPIFVTWTRVPTARERAAVDERWGRPNHWLRIPDFSLSLWWPFALSLVLPTIWVTRRRRRAAKGFPVVAARRAT